MKITIDVRFSETPPPPGKPDVLDGWPLSVLCGFVFGQTASAYRTLWLMKLALVP